MEIHVSIINNEILSFTDMCIYVVYVCKAYRVMRSTFDSWTLSMCYC